MLDVWICWTCRSDLLQRKCEAYEDAGQLVDPGGAGTVGSVGSAGVLCSVGDFGSYRVVAAAPPRLQLGDGYLSSALP